MTMVLLCGDDICWFAKQTHSKDLYEKLSEFLFTNFMVSIPRIFNN